MGKELKKNNTIDDLLVESLLLTIIFFLKSSSLLRVRGDYGEILMDGDGVLCALDRVPMLAHLCWLGD